MGGSSDTGPAPPHDNSQQDRVAAASLVEVFLLSTAG